MEKRLPLSVCMIAGAEAHRIGRALESVADWAGEIVVVLNQEVADGTDRVAAGHGAKVFREPWKGHIAQKNSAAQKAAQPWILGLDADEVVSPELRGEIRALFADPGRLEAFDAFSFPRLTQFCGRWIRHGDWYPDRGTRLWRRGRAKWGGLDPHDKLMVDGTTGKLNSDLHHFTSETLGRQVQKIIPYSNAFVRQKAGTSAGFFDLVIRPAWRFLRGYIFRLGFLDGWQGYYIAWMNAFATVTKYARLCEAQAQATAEKTSGPGRA